MKIAVIGANGQRGTDVFPAFTESGDEVAHSDIEIADLNSVSRALAGPRPGIIVNTAAMHYVENCERQIRHLQRTQSRREILPPWLAI